MFEWFDADEALKFAEEVSAAAEPLLAMISHSGKAHAGKKDQRRFDGLLARVGDYSKTANLNVYKKARFLNAVKWRLREAGHDQNLVDDFIALLTGAMNR